MDNFMYFLEYSVNIMKNNRKQIEYARNQTKNSTPFFHIGSFTTANAKGFRRIKTGINNYTAVYACDMIWGGEIMDFPFWRRGRIFAVLQSHTHLINTLDYHPSLLKQRRGDLLCFPTSLFNDAAYFLVFFQMIYTTIPNPAAVRTNRTIHGVRSESSPV